MTTKTRLDRLESVFTVRVLESLFSQFAERLRVLLTNDECRVLSERLRADGLAAFDDLLDIRAKIMADPLAADLLRRVTSIMRAAQNLEAI